MKSGRKIIIAILSLAFIFSIATVPALAGDKPVVGLVMKSLANEFFKTIGHLRKEGRRRRDCGG